ncbi:MAG TPA: glutamate-5-semialdehyde dehydrogenase [Nannocystis exedens]|nr:glutamate-5-semialdehyde dehydrogenase [Nannocystis exedens]
MSERSGLLLPTDAATRDVVRAAAVEARAAGPVIAGLSASARRALLRSLADALGDSSVRDELQRANRKDLDRAAKSQLAEVKRARLDLPNNKLDALADGLRQLASAPELLGKATLRRELDEGLVLERVPCPLGTLGVVVEARPDAIPQIAGLAIKSGNALLLKGGSEALESNRALVALIRRLLVAHNLPEGSVCLLEQREDFGALLGMHDLVDLIIARGSTPFVRRVMASTEIPVMGHAEGLCHIYLHPPVEPMLAARIVVDAKCSYPAACNAVETLLWHPGAGSALDACIAALAAEGVELRGCGATRARAPGIAQAGVDDWRREYGSKILAIRQVADLEVALEHIACYGSRHTEAVLSEDKDTCTRFVARVDAAAVFVNVSTRFTDGYRFGLGAEVGISTGKLHARGPVGVDGLLTYRWILRGCGQVTADYGPGKRMLRRRDLSLEL